MKWEMLNKRVTLSLANANQKDFDLFCHFQYEQTLNVYKWK